MCCANLINRLKVIKKFDCLSDETSHSEQGKTFSLINHSNKSVYKVIVEDGLLTKNDGEGKRCECLFYACPETEVFFLELKGNDVNKACKQLKNSINKVKSLLEFEQVKIRPILVHNQNPKASQRLKKHNEQFRQMNLVLESYTDAHAKIKI